MNRALKALDRYLTWLALWLIGVVAVYVGYVLASNSSPNFDLLDYIHFGAVIAITFIIAIIVDSGTTGWLAAFFFLFGPPFGAWAIYRAIRWIAGY